ncbi:hypothetical protein [Actinomycetospora succinea]|uniref:hypothetical protein n=1 Tax=Actinomycetospora succinea TaxID=663603 RepID=UPI00106204AD|nr:hypothetical protein [Actinomycetospora succinea]
MSRKRKPKKIKQIATPKGKKLSQLRANVWASELSLIPIVGDGAIVQRGEAWGKLIPVLLIDSSERPDVRELFRLHSDGMGDVTYKWRLGSREPYTAFLTLSFERPVRCSFTLELPVNKYGGLTDIAVANELVSLQSAKAGDRLSDKPNEDRIVVQVGSDTFRAMWYDYYEKATISRFLARGFDRSASKKSANAAIEQHRILNNIRFS